MQKGKNESKETPRSDFVLKRRRKRGRNTSSMLKKRKPVKRYMKGISKPIKKRPWNDEEDALLASLVDQLGSQRWSEIAKKIKGREGKQCRERWHNHLNPDIKKGPWNIREQWILYLSHKKLGNRWSKISKNLCGRTDNAIKNHWNSIMRKRLPEFKIKLESIYRERCTEEIVHHDVLEDLISKERDLLREEEPRYRPDRSPRKNSSGSTRDEEKSPNKSMYNNNFDLGFLSDYYSSPKKAPLIDDDIETSPIINKSHFQNYGLFEDISFSTNIPCFRFNSFYNDTHESPFDL